MIREDSTTWHGPQSKNQMFPIWSKYTQIPYILTSMGDNKQFLHSADLLILHCQGSRSENILTHVFKPRCILKSVQFIMYNFSLNRIFWFEKNTCNIFSLTEIKAKLRTQIKIKYWKFNINYFPHSTFCNL